MLLVDDIDNKDFLNKLLNSMVEIACSKEKVISKSNLSR